VCVEGSIGGSTKVVVCLDVLLDRRPAVEYPNVSGIFKEVDRRHGGVMATAV